MLALYRTPRDRSASDMISPKELDTWLRGALVSTSGPPALEQSLQKAIAVWGKSVFEQFDTECVPMPLVPQRSWFRRRRP